MLNFKLKNNDQRNYWGLLYLSNCIKACANINNKDFINKVYNSDYYNTLLGCSFLLATSNIYDSINILAEKLNTKIDFTKLDRELTDQYKEQTDNLYCEIFGEDSNANKLKEDLLFYYGIKSK